MAAPNKSKATRADDRSLTATATTRQARHDDGNAFIADPGDGPAHTRDTLAQELAEEFLLAATSGEPTEALDEEVTEERGGPFVTTPARREFARGTDASNPRDAQRESLPSPMRGQ